MLNTNWLFASLLWGSVGVGYFVYGKKQQCFSALLGGILMLVVSYFVGSALVMSLACIGIVAGVFLLTKLGY